MTRMICPECGLSIAECNEKALERQQLKVGKLTVREWTPSPKPDHVLRVDREGKEPGRFVTIEDAVRHAETLAGRVEIIVYGAPHE